MTSETPHLHVSKNLNISKRKQDIEKLKTLLRLYGNVVLLCLKLDQRFFLEALLMVFKAVASSIIGEGADIHIFVFCTINFL